METREPRPEQPAETSSPVGNGKPKLELDSKNWTFLGCTVERKINIVQLGMFILAIIVLCAQSFWQMRTIDIGQRNIEIAQRNLDIKVKDIRDVGDEVRKVRDEFLQDVARKNHIAQVHDESLIHGWMNSSISANRLCLAVGMLTKAVASEGPQQREELAAVAKFMAAFAELEGAAVVNATHRKDCKWRFDKEKAALIAKRLPLDQFLFQEHLLIVKLAEETAAADKNSAQRLEAALNRVKQCEETILMLANRN